MTGHFQNPPANARCKHKWGRSVSVSLALLYKTQKESRFTGFQVTGNKDKGISHLEGHWARGLSCGEARKQDSADCSWRSFPNSVSSAHVGIWDTEQDKGRKRCRGGRECLCLKYILRSLPIQSLCAPSSKPTLNYSFQGAAWNSTNLSLCRQGQKLQRHPFMWAWPLLLRTHRALLPGTDYKINNRQSEKRGGGRAQRPGERA